MPIDASWICREIFVEHYLSLRRRNNVSDDDDAKSSIAFFILKRAKIDPKHNAENADLLDALWLLLSFAIQIGGRHILWIVGGSISFVCIW